VRVIHWLLDAFKPKPNLWGNEIHTICPYKWMGMWVFDDPRVDLRMEAFIAGADTFIDVSLLKLGIKGGEDGFRATFSATPFPGHQFTLVKMGKDRGGTVYLAAESGVEGWLCPALLRYFQKPPDRIYTQFECLAKEEQALVCKDRPPPRSVIYLPKAKAGYKKMLTLEEYLAQAEIEEVHAQILDDDEGVDLEWDWPFPAPAVEEGKEK